MLFALVRLAALLPFELLRVLFALEARLLAAVLRALGCRELAVLREPLPDLVVVLARFRPLLVDLELLVPLEEGRDVPPLLPSFEVNASTASFGACAAFWAPLATFRAG